VGGVLFEIKIGHKVHLLYFSLLALTVGLATAGFCPREKQDGLECRAKE
jgi:hypothetical protein